MKLYTFKDAARFAFIETQLFWGDGLTAQNLAQAFKITRPAAQASISLYRKHHPNQMRYDPQLKKHVKTDNFVPRYIKKNSSLFLDFLRGQILIGYFLEVEDWSDIQLTDVDRLLKPDLQTETISAILSALRHHQALEIDYLTKYQKTDSLRSRIISPNHLIFVDNRYHIRAYCHTKNRFLDFVLSRIYRATPISLDWVSSIEDTAWQIRLDVVFRPNPQLPQKTQKAILRDFEDKAHPGTRRIKCRKALYYYIQKKLLAPDTQFGIPLWIKEELFEYLPIQ